MMGRVQLQNWKIVEAGGAATAAIWAQIENCCAPPLSRKFDTSMLLACAHSFVTHRMNVSDNHFWNIEIVRHWSQWHQHLKVLLKTIQWGGEGGFDKRHAPPRVHSANSPPAAAAAAAVEAVNFNSPPQSWPFPSCTLLPNPTMWTFQMLITSQRTLVIFGKYMLQTFSHKLQKRSPPSVFKIWEQIFSQLMGYRFANQVHCGRILLPRARPLHALGAPECISIPLQRIYSQSPVHI